MSQCHLERFPGGSPPRVWQRHADLILVTVCDHGLARPGGRLVTIVGPAACHA